MLFRSSPTGQQVVDNTPTKPVSPTNTTQTTPKTTPPEQTDDITGQYTHSQFPDATATVTKTDKGYDIDWGDEVQSFTGKNALEKAKATLAKESFTKGKPKDEEKPAKSENGKKLIGKNNIKIDEQSNEQNSINRKTENLAPVEKSEIVSITIHSRI